MTTKLTQHPDTLLPFYVNGTLSAAQKAEVLQHLETCERCWAEIKYLEKIRQHIKELTPAQPPGELGLRRLLRDVKREKTRKTPATWWKPAMAAAMLVIVLQAGLLLQHQDSSETYAPLGVTQSGIQISFKPTATEAQIRLLLNRVNARITDGPGALGVYRIELQNKTLTPEQYRTVLAQLRQQEIVLEVVP